MSSKCADFEHGSVCNLLLGFRDWCMVKGKSFACCKYMVCDESIMRHLVLSTWVRIFIQKAKGLPVLRSLVCVLPPFQTWYMPSRRVSWLRVYLSRRFGPFWSVTLISRAWARFVQKLSQLLEVLNYRCVAVEKRGLRADKLIVRRTRVPRVIGIGRIRRKRGAWCNSRRFLRRQRWWSFMLPQRRRWRQRRPDQLAVRRADGHDGDLTVMHLVFWFIKIPWKPLTFHLLKPTKSVGVRLENEISHISPFKK